MADYRTPGYDLQDETNCADSCEAVIALCELVDELITDIQHLELECISTRHLLSKYLEADKGELLRMDILSNLPPSRSSEPAYELFKNISSQKFTFCCYGISPSNAKFRIQFVPITLVRNNPVNITVPVCCAQYSNQF